VIEADLDAAIVFGSRSNIQEMLQPYG